MDTATYFDLAITFCKRHLTSMRDDHNRIYSVYKHDYAHYAACLKRLEQHDLFTAHAIFQQLTLARPSIQK